MHEIERTKVEEMEIHLKSIEKDCEEMIREGDEQMQTLKKESHQKPIKLHHTQKDVEVGKLEIK